MIHKHQCICTSPGYCKLFLRTVTNEEYDDCRNSHTSLEKADRVELMYAVSGAGRCVHKGNPVLDEAGFPRKRQSASCCGNFSRPSVAIYYCNKFGDAGFAEDACESRCTEFVSHHLGGG